jgi:hypothetical protein
MRVRGFARAGLIGLLIVSACLALAWGPASRVQRALAEAAMEQIKEHVVYDGSYRQIEYPDGDVPRNRGVCADVVIRAYRELGVDLQVLVHEDMRDNFRKYPNLWGLTAPDTNIDHRRVPNLATFFARNGEKLRVTDDGLDYLPGDLVTFTVAGSLPHIGIVSTELTPDGKRPMMVHNIGEGPKLEDMLFSYPITGHYRYPAS